MILTKVRIIRVIQMVLFVSSDLYHPLSGVKTKLYRAVNIFAKVNIKLQLRRVFLYLDFLHDELLTPNCYKSNHTIYLYQNINYPISKHMFY